MGEQPARHESNNILLDLKKYDWGRLNKLIEHKHNLCRILI
jgi:hypothetical protein